MNWNMKVNAILWIYRQRYTEVEMVEHQQMKHADMIWQKGSQNPCDKRHPFTQTQTEHVLEILFASLLSLTTFLPSHFPLSPEPLPTFSISSAVPLFCNSFQLLSNLLHSHGPVHRNFLVLCHRQTMAHPKRTNGKRLKWRDSNTIYIPIFLVWCEWCKNCAQSWSVWRD